VPPTQRLFVAVYPPAPAITDLAGLVSRLAFTRPHPEGLSLRPVPPEQWHVTVAFLGELDPAQLDATIAAMSATAAATPHAPRLRLSGGGRFPNGRAAAIWAGLHGDLDELHELANRLRGALTEARVPFDPRPYPGPARRPPRPRRAARGPRPARRVRRTGLGRARARAHAQRPPGEQPLHRGVQRTSSLLTEEPRWNATSAPSTTC
jgi:2'-5' RNA ligase